MLTIDLVAHNIKVVRADYLGNQFFDNSWRIVAMFQDDVAELSSVPRPSGAYQAPGTPVHSQEPGVAVVKKTFLLLARTESEPVIAELRAELEQFKRLRETAQRETEKAKDEAKDLKERCERLKASNEMISNDFRAASKSASNAEDAKRKLECDLAKVRKALGELRWKEILDSKEG